MDTPEVDLERFKELNEREWTDPSIVEGWKKWHRQANDMARPLSEILIDRGEIESGHHVLDLASGSGEPAASLASVVGSGGRVVATDFSERMIAVAEENLSQLRLDNFECRQADAHSLPFPDESFDRVTCRHGAMYFADLDSALRETFRVLKPGGRVVFSAWGPFEQPLFMSTIGVLMKHVELPPPEPNAPNPFRFAEEGSFEHRLKGAGYREVKEERASVPVSWDGTPEQLWNWLSDISPMIAPVLGGVDSTVREAVLSEIHSEIGKHEMAGQVRMNWDVVLATGVK